MKNVLLGKLLTHPLLQNAIRLRGNPKYLVRAEPLISIPKTLYTPFATLYMYSLGLSDTKIGMVASIWMFSSIFAALFGGIITDRLGRKRTTCFVDLICWSSACFAWMLAQNFWWFVVAAVLNSTMYIAYTSWSCLIAESTDKRTVPHVFSLIYMSGQFAVFFAPFAGLMVKQLTIVPAARILYGTACVLITTRICILLRFCKETELGLIRIQESKNESLLHTLAGYKSVFKTILSSRPMLMSLWLMVTVTVSNAVINNFFGLYATRTLGFPDEYLAYFPMLRAVVMLSFMLGIQHLLYRFAIKVPFMAGLVLYMASQVVLILSRTASIPMIIAYIVCEALAFAIVVPGNDTIAALFIEPSQRAKIFGVIAVVMLSVSAPFGIIAGRLSEINRRLPFAMNMVFFLIALIIVANSHALSKAHEA